MLIEIGDDYFETDHIAVIRERDAKSTIIFTIGSSAVDGGFIVNLPIDDVIQKLTESRFRGLADSVLNNTQRGGVKEREQLSE